MTDEEKPIMEEWTVTQEEAKAEKYTNEKHCKKCINFAECVESAIEDRCKTYRESYKDYLNGLTEGRKDDKIKEGLKWVLNRIPCKKNCSSCSRDGWLSCFEPDRFYIEDKLAKEIIQKYKEE